MARVILYTVVVKRNRFAYCVNGFTIMGVGSGGQGSHAPPLDFHIWYKYSREREAKKCYFSVFFAIFRSLFFVGPPGRGSIVLFFWIVLLFFGLFSVVPALPGNFSADALVHYCGKNACVPL